VTLRTGGTIFPLQNERSILALTHIPSPQMQACELTYVSPAPIDIELAAQQHVQYCQTLRELGAGVVTLSDNRHLPDCTFIEDTAVALDEVAIITPMGTESRRTEPRAIATELAKYRQLVSIAPPAKLEGGDVLRIGRTLLVGQSSRSNNAGIAALTEAVRRWDYRVIAVPVHGCLHLKTACTALPDGRLLANRGWFDSDPIREFKILDVPSEEPFGANVALVGSRVLMSATHVRTADLLSRNGFQLRTIAISEFEKAEGGVTCLSILLNASVRKPA
jgi:dimethylargininase